MVIVVGVAILAPFAWMIATALMTPTQTLKATPAVIPSPPTLQGVDGVFAKLPFLRLLVNTVLASAGRALATLIIASLAAYALAIIKVPGARIVLLLVLTLIMVPGDIFIIPSFSIMAKLHLTNTLVALVLPNLFDVFGVFLLYQFFRGVPRELIEAALIDGASHLRILFTIVVPVCRSGLIALAILTVLNEWKELLWPIVVNRDVEKLTLGPGLALLRGTAVTDWNVLMSAGAMATLPMIVIFLLLQRHFVSSLARSGLK
ncbi:carbohydrate ABC transporter permease [Streptomyces chartreusis]|uniref:carbohydrate ABC transporter permease n=1 Tax=Streptomyces chartreusis TaxID=1969 RepID=UPI0033D87958